MKAIALGDIGCYTLGALPPLGVLESAIDMGASVSMGHGFEVARMVGRERGEAEVTGGKRPVFSVIGDSTFAHSGLSGVISRVYNGGTGTVLILDNRTPSAASPSRAAPPTRSTCPRSSRPQASRT